MLRRSLIPLGRICSTSMQFPRYFAKKRREVAKAPKKGADKLIKSLSEEIQYEKEKYTGFKEGDVYYILMLL